MCKYDSIIQVLVQSNQTVGEQVLEKILENVQYYLVSYNFDIINNDWKLEPIIFSRTFNNQNIVLILSLELNI